MLILLSINNHSRWSTMESDEQKILELQKRISALENENKELTNELNQRKLHEIELQQKVDEYSTLYEEYSTINEKLHKTNAELMHAKTIAEENEQNFKNLIDLAPYAVVITDMQGRYLLLNKSFIRESKYSIEEVMGKNNYEIGLEVNRESSETISTKLKQDGFVENIEVTTVDKYGTLTHSIYSSQVVQYQNQPAIFSVTLNINEIKKAQKELKESEQRYRLLVDNIMYPVIISTAEGNVLYINKQTELFFGRTVEELSTLKSFDFWAFPNKRNEYVSELKLKGYVYNKEVILRNENGETITVLMSSNIITYYGEQVIFSVYNDISKLKLLEQEILNTAIETEELERQRFAQELHDGIGPLLSTIKMYVQWLLKPDSKADKTKILEKIQSIVVETHETVRQISFKLSPHILQNFGLIAALHSFTEKIQETASIFIKIDAETYLQKSIQLETILYRILTECITNTLKHAEASEIWIQITENDKKIMIHFSDNGKGFDLNERKDTGLGLNNIKARLQSINGGINLHSQLGKGTKIDIDLLK